MTFEINNILAKDIWIIQEIFEVEFSVFAELHMRLPTGLSTPMRGNGFRLTNYDIVKLETGAIRKNTSTFATPKKNPTGKQKSPQYRITVGGVYCSTMTNDYYPIDFIKERDWVEVKRSEQ